ncbi:hypothetical protein AXG93_939s1060 [Marchantia polymorpha subsp. ruderalis]|uniref:Uncharacterized protein n=1 Tax=Marchantia polymorpha subsp. ruderalis TaxID=1480154 RepID=A0A176VKV7_MARPO|nr:hypothetical protein AXG93_939s1060 [Marchantia polymorpha subsp. ruderalis]
MQLPVSVDLKSLRVDWTRLMFVTRHEGTSGGVGATGASTSNSTVSIAGGGMSGDASGVPSFSPIPEFFKRLRKKCQGWESWSSDTTSFMTQRAKCVVTIAFIFWLAIGTIMLDMRKWSYEEGLSSGDTETNFTG